MNTIIATEMGSAPVVYITRSVNHRIPVMSHLQPGY